MAAVISEQAIGGERALNLGYAVLVASQSENGWHEVRDGRCTCAGFQYRGRCRAIAAGAAQQPAEPELPTCPTCGGPVAKALRRLVRALRQQP